MYLTPDYLSNLACHQSRLLFVLALLQSWLRDQLQTSKSWCHPFGSVQRELRYTRKIRFFRHVLVLTKVNSRTSCRRCHILLRPRCIVVKAELVRVFVKLLIDARSKLISLQVRPAFNFKQAKMIVALKSSIVFHYSRCLRRHLKSFHVSECYSLQKVSKGVLRHSINKLGLRNKKFLRLECYMLNKSLEYLEVDIITH